MSSNYKSLLPAIKQIIPALTSTLHKGSNGRIGVIGGSLEYTGAPYFAAMSALLVGADLVHVFCTKAAAPVIKSYSPELIVHPLLDSDNPVEDISPWLQRLHALVIGPGLGRDESILKTVMSIINLYKSEKPIPIVIDADGLHLLTISPDLLKGLQAPVILTPNKIEFSRLAGAFQLQNATALDVARALNVVVLQKGETDFIANGTTLDSDGITATCKEEGSPRRSGGQGDVLSGSLATFAAWQSLTPLQHPLGYGVPAAAASALTRHCSHLAFQKYGRSMVASNLIEFIHTSFEDLFGQ